ncbi:SLCO3A [Lepeophtheirus salmonis]|uniref:SLCO3A n=1 Tax=Lepeophtheirus salmonis TaxID=72036 RepID=A0A7R8CPG1_LEPSM|nr:SLCO3A [Lepeophtheirus salmonis]CAF2886084.1 SLCO3A [Lepeophtheirus salmonis]
MKKKELHEMQDELEDLRDCGLGACRPSCMQSLSSIKVFVFLLSVLVTLQQALSSGYLNSVITTIEKRYEIPSSITGIIASMYDIGNVITVIFVSYLGSRRRIPVWIGMGVLVMGIGSITFSLPHFLSDSHSIKSDINGSSTDNICRGPRIIPHKSAEDLLIEKLPALGNIKSLAEGLPNPPLAPHNNQYNRKGNCIEEANESAALPIFIFMLSQLLLGCGGSPLFTLGTTYIDNHVKREIPPQCTLVLCIPCVRLDLCAASYLGHIYFHSMWTRVHPIFSSLTLDSTDRHWVGMWWGGFLICGVLMILISIPFFFFPKELKKEKVKVYIDDKYHHAKDPSIRPKHHSEQKSIKIEDDNYGKDIKDIPRSTLETSH